MSKARVSTVTIGSNISIIGLRLICGTFAISVSQLADLISIPQKNSSREFKALLGKEFQFLKAASELHPKAVNILTLSQAETIILETALAGNPQSVALLRALAGTALNEFFCDAFDIESNAETRKAQIDARYQGIEVRNSFTDAIKLWLEQHPEASDNTRKFIYSNVSDLLNRSLTGHNAKHWKDLLGCKSDTLRDHWKPSHLDKISDLEKHAKVLVIRGVHPREAMEAAVTFHEFAIDGNPQGVAS